MQSLPKGCGQTGGLRVDWRGWRCALSWQVRIWVCDFASLKRFKEGHDTNGTTKVVPCYKTSASDAETLHAPGIVWRQ